MQSSIKSLFIGITLGASALFLGACNEEQTASPKSDAIQLNLELPDSLTGNATPAAKALTFRAAGTGEPCAFHGNENDNPFVNGYEMTKFMTSVVATWTCISENIIAIVDFLPHDGKIKEGDNDFSSENYDADEPTHYSVTEHADHQITVRTYYGYDRAAPPTDETAPDIFVSWLSGENGDIDGRLIIQTGRIPKDKAEDPDRMRMDFTFTAAEKRVDMYLAFDESPWANGFRIQVVKELAANPLTQVFTAKGLMDMNRQFLPNVSSGELPDLKMHTVANAFGKGAAAASLNNVALPITFNLDNFFGEYIFDNDDRYFFDADGDYDYIHKSIVASTYTVARNTPETGGSWPNDPSLDLIRDKGALAADYFITPGLCADIGDSCNELLNAFFENGFGDQEKNQGELPDDWRATALAKPDYLESVYPLGFESWDGVFEPTFTP